jgi:hypothetical protein
MKRRNFGLMAASSLAATATMPGASKLALAQSAPDASLLATTLTPLGGERAGNADGSIPAWTGGLVTDPVPTSQPIDVVIFADESPLYEVNAGNMAQYANFLSPGTQALMKNRDFRIKVFQTHRTAAAPQYIYDNTEKNVTRAQLVPEGGRFGFSGGFAGPPFPIPSTDPSVAGAQVIWNHLVRWQTFQNFTKFSGSYVITGHDTVILTFGGSSHFSCGYYDPNGSPETYDGYLSKLHEFYLAPSVTNGQEAIVWTSSNVLVKPNITWAVIPGQGRVRKAPNEAYDTPNATSNGINNYDDSSGFAGSPQKYDWKVIGKQEMLVPYNCNGLHAVTAQTLMQPAFPNPDFVRWEKHRVWIVEARLHPGERNTTARRMVYIDEDTWMILLADMYDADDNLVKTAAVYNRSVGSLPCTWEVAEAFWDLRAGAYNMIGSMRCPPYDNAEYLKPQSLEMFDAEQMAASSSF